MIWRLSTSFLFLVILGVNGIADVTSTNAMERYKSIIDKNPFKRISDAVSINPTSQAGSLSLLGYFSNRGTEKKVWLRDSSQNNKTFWVGEKEIVNGYRVDKIDVENRSVE